MIARSGSGGSRGLFFLVLGTALGLGASTASAADPAAAEFHVESARRLAGSDLAKPLFLCDPKGASVLAQVMGESANRWLEPAQAFDNLYFLGTPFVGVWVIKTSEGLVLFDSGQSSQEARDRIVPGLRKLELDPAQIKYVFVTHGHWDHYGGASVFQKDFGARIGLSDADWTLMAKQQPDSPEREGRELPSKDFVIADGQEFTLGDTTIRFFVTPGHTPGTISAIIPAREDGKIYPMSLLGGTLFPPTLEPTERHGGLLAFDESVKRLAAESAAAGAVGLLNTHISVDGSAERLAAAGVRTAGEPNPFLIGKDAVARHYGILHHCLQAKMARPIDPDEWSRPPGSTNP